MGNQAAANHRGDHPEFERRLFEERTVDLNAARRQPLTGFEDSIDGIRVDSFVATEIPAIETDEQRRAEESEDDEQAAGADEWRIGCGKLHLRRT
jgi:hypothetical protein